MLMRVALIGPYPMNVGGISMHLKRLSRLLKDECEFVYIDEGRSRFNNVFNLRSLNLFRYLSIVRKVDTVHINSGHYLLRIFNIIVCKLLLHKHTVVTVHRNPEAEPCLSITRRLLNKCDHVIFVNKEAHDLLAGCDKSGRFVVRPAFLPPVLDEEPQLPASVLQWIQDARTKPNHCILVSNAWNLVMHQGEDLYGLDICIQAAIRLCKSECTTQYFFIFVVASCTENTEMLNRYQKQIKDNGLDRNFLIWISPLSFVKLLSCSDVMLRTTNTDGDAISVREALFLRKKVIASDVVDRPRGVILFKNRDVESLTDAIKKSVGQDLLLTENETTDYKSFYLSLYKSNNETTNAKTS